VSLIGDEKVVEKYPQRCFTSVVLHRAFLGDYIYVTLKKITYVEAVTGAATGL
jgi:hypothetical protein